MQSSPGRLLQSVERSSLEVWDNSNSGINAKATTVSYYIKGNVLGLLLDARIRRATMGRASFWTLEPSPDRTPAQKERLARWLGR